MKEFLNPDQGYKLVCCEVGETSVPDNWIEIPEGAIFLVSHDSKETHLTFYGNKNKKGHYKCYPICGINANTWAWSDYRDDSFNESSCNNSGRRVLWQREKFGVESGKLDTDAMLADIDVQIATHSQHGHYFKDVRDLNVIDVYQVLRLFNVTDPCLQHIVKKALVAGGRGHKNFERDLKDIHDTSKRALEINNILH